MKDVLMEAIIHLTRGQKAIVDAADLPDLLKYRWFAHNRRSGGIIVGFEPARYLSRKTGNGRVRSGTITMARHLMGNPAGFVDHINGNPLDNRRSNLRSATRSQNAINWRRVNRTGMRGVTKNGSGYVARIGVGNAKKLNLGTFASPNEAAVAYDAAAIRYHREFAVLNRGRESHAVPA